MVTKIILLSGPVCSGKTTLSSLLAKRFGIEPLKTRQVLKALYPDVESERTAMQELGERLDRRTRGGWVCRGLEKLIRGIETKNPDSPSAVIVDAVRIKGQIDGIRRAYGDRTIHVHLDAPVETLAQRYANRSHDEVRELRTYDEVRQNKTEHNVYKLRRTADVVVDTFRCTPDDVMVKVASHLGLYGRQYNRVVDVLIGGQYGSEGKGHVASFLAKEYDFLVRVGGPNAGHTVFLEPDPYTFHHLPSGTRTSNAMLIIGAGATVYIPGLMKEISECHIDCERLRIDEQTMVITEKDRRAEQGIRRAMGSTAQGGGAAAARRIKNREPGKVKLARDYRQLRPFVTDTCAILEDAYRVGKKVMLEGTQGTGLSLYHGSYPYVTSRDTTVAGCLAEAGISPGRVRKIVMTCRVYPIRVENPMDGESGPMCREINWGIVEKRSGYPEGTLDAKELTSTTKRKRRVGEFEWANLRKAASLNAPTDIALTFCDYVTIENTKARRFEQLSQETIRFIEDVERVATAPVSLISTRFDFRSIIDRRAW